MRIATLAPAALALAVPAFLLLPERGSAFSVTGRSQSAETGRFLRVFNNFQDPQSNDNQIADPNFPGFTGAPLAIWKAAAEWGSGPFGDGSGDPTQARVGDGGANFDFVFAGLADAQGSLDDRIVSATTNAACDLGLVSFVEFGAGDGWRIRICDSSIVWDDGPGVNDPNTIDLQGVLAHELGVVLGLGSSSDPTATMFPVIGAASYLPRSIEADDAAGVQFVYGVKSASKPTISAATYDAASGLLTLDGANFDPSGNEVWFTFAAPSAAGANAELAVQGVASTNGGTRIVVAPPRLAGPGNVAVKLAASGFATLSNAFPLGYEGATPASCTVANGSGVNPAVFACVTTPILGSTWQAEVDGSALGATGASFAIAFAQPLVPLPTAFGELLVDPTSPFVALSTASFVAGIASHAEGVPANLTVEGLGFAIQVYLPALQQLTNRLDLVVGAF